ncbi:MAG: hypothetical protein FWC42_00330 [Proteobacteria bacterium]|nr:hypothetical protein [Pseudomonadota bacterium]
MNSLSAKSARELLQFHSCKHEDVNHPKWRSGFLGSLRPYTGLNAKNFHEVMQCLKVLAPQLQQAPSIDREIIATLWSICHLGRAWGVEPQGMLRRNGFISIEDSVQLEEWIFQISYTAFCLFDGYDIETAFEDYENV